MNKNLLLTPPIICLLMLIMITVIVWYESGQYSERQQKTIIDAYLTPTLNYDGLQLTKKSHKIKQIKNNQSKKSVDCNTNILECNSNEDCSSKYCINLLGYDKAVCKTGLCRYVLPAQSSSSATTMLCQNDGILTSFFSYGRNITTCICPDQYIGNFCEITNEMAPALDKSIDI